MKNGRALKGHRRIQQSHGTRSSKIVPFSGGWDVACIYGWRVDGVPTSSDARKLYRVHIDYLIDHGLFKCKRCGAEKPGAQMRPDYRYICLACFSDLGNDWQRRHPQRSAGHKRNCHLIKKFGITLQEESQIREKQHGVCAICERSLTDKRGYSPHVDHDHKSGLVRGLLCLPCNSGLGSFRDRPDLLRRAIAYLERSAS